MKRWKVFEHVLILLYHKLCAWLKKKKTRARLSANQNKANINKLRWLARDREGARWLLHDIFRIKSMKMIFLWLLCLSYLFFFNWGSICDYARNVQYFLQEKFVCLITVIIKRNVPQNSENKPRGLYFSKALLDGLTFGGGYIRGEICVSKPIGLPLGYCFTLYSRAIFQVQAPGGLIFGGAI